MSQTPLCWRWCKASAWPVAPKAKTKERSPSKPQAPICLRRSALHRAARPVPPLQAFLEMKKSQLFPGDDAVRKPPPTDVVANPAEQSFEREQELMGLQEDHQCMSVRGIPVVGETPSVQVRSGPGL